MTSEIELSEAKRQLLQKRMSGAGPARAREVAGVVPRSFGEIIPLSSEQGQVWLHAAMSPDVPIYNESITIDRRGSFDLDVLERSFNEILRRHEIWRTSFEIVDDQIVQIVHPHLTVRLTLYDLTSLPSTARNAEALRMATE